MYALQRSVDAHSAELQRAASLESLLKQLQLSAGDSLHELFAPGRRLRHSGRGSIVKHYGGYDVRSYGAAGSGTGSNGGGGDDSQLCLLFSDCLIHIERRADAGGGRKAPARGRSCSESIWAICRTCGGSTPPPRGAANDEPSLRLQLRPAVRGGTDATYTLRLADPGLARSG